jgi:hypothetical protein
MTRCTCSVVALCIPLVVIRGEGPIVYRHCTSFRWRNPTFHGKFMVWTMEGPLKMKNFIPLCLLLSSSPALADWNVHQGPQVFSLSPSAIATIANVEAKGPSNGVTARLQLECFTHPELSTLSFGIIISKPTAPGALKYRIQFDDGPAIERGPYTRLKLTSDTLVDEDKKALPTAKRLRLTLLPTKPPELTYDFNVSGAAAAIKTLNCKEFRRY